jgi:hypothetical protein
MMNNMTRSTKILLGAASIWPIVYMFIFFIFVFGLMFMSNAGPVDPGGFEAAFGFGIIALFIVHFLTIFLTLGLTVFYIIHAIKNEAINSDMKAVWAVLFFFGGMIAEPIYWYLHIWKDPGTVGPPPGLAAGDPSARAASWSDAQRADEYVPRNQPPDWR